MLTIPFSAGQACVGVGFMMLGYVMKNNKYYTINDIQNTKWYFFGLMLIMATVLAFVNSPVNMRTSEYGNVILFWIDALIWCIILIKIANFLEHSQVLVLFCTLLKKIGSNSITYVCLNQLVLYALGFVFKRIEIRGYISNVILFIGCMAIIYICNKIILNSWICIIFGKDRNKRNNVK